MIHLLDIVRMDHGTESIAAVAEVVDGVAEDLFWMTAEGDVIGDGVPIEEDLAGGHDSCFVTCGPFALGLFDAFPFGDIAEDEGDELDTTLGIGLSGDELRDLKESSVVALDGAFAFPVRVFHAAGDGLLDEDLVVVRGDDVADMKVAWVGVVIEAEEGVCGSVEVDDLAGGRGDDHEVGRVLHDGGEAAHFFFGFSSSGDIDHDPDGAEWWMVWVRVVELGGGFEDDPAG